MVQQLEFRLSADDRSAFVLRRNPQLLAASQPIVVDAATALTGGRPRAVKAQNSLLPPDANAADAFRLTLVQCKWHITANMAAVLDARDADGLHQMRVALRRLRVALSSFGGEFRSPALETIALRAKALGGRIAPARDLDVFTQDLLEPAAGANGAQDAFALLRARAEAARRDAWNDTVALVGGVSFRFFLRDLEDAIDGSWIRDGMSGEATTRIAAFDAPVTALADRMLAYRQRKACKHARHLSTLSVAERHRLRIALKKLRYTAEFFAPLYDRARGKKYLSRLSAMQEVLGALNDVAVAHDTLEKLVCEPTDGLSAAPAALNFAAGIVYGWHMERAARIWKGASRCWKKFSQTRAFWNAPAA